MRCKEEKEGTYKTQDEDGNINPPPIKKKRNKTLCGRLRKKRRRRAGELR